MRSEAGRTGGRLNRVTMSCSPSPRRLLAVLSVVGLFATCLPLSSASADARTAYLARLLRRSDNFRVRVQAAITLGGGRGGAKAVEALQQALEDPHPAVRTAAAASLGRLEDPSALAAIRAAERRERHRGARAALKRARRRLEKAARRRPTGSVVEERAGPPDVAPGGPAARYLLVVGEPGGRGVGSEEREWLKEAVERELRALGASVASAPSGRSGARRLQARARARRLRTYQVDSSVVKVEQTDRGLRAVVSVILNTYPGRAIRAMMQGKATVPGGRGASARKLAIQAAARGALRRIVSALEQADARGGS